MTTHDMTITGDVRAIYEATEPHIKARLRREFASCRVACAACCYQLVAVMWAEALTIAEEVRTWPDYAAVLTTCQADALMLNDIVEKSAGYAALIRWYSADGGAPCPLLDVGSRLCRVYPVRPGACRHHAVVTDASLCAVGAPTGAIPVDFVTERGRLIEDIAEVSVEHGVPVGCVPLQVGLAWALTTGRPDIRLLGRWTKLLTNTGMSV
jgi:Fe-S-cluster containining protein